MGALIFIPLSFPFVHFISLAVRLLFSLLITSVIVFMFEFAIGLPLGASSSSRR